MATNFGAAIVLSIALVSGLTSPGFAQQAATKLGEASLSDACQGVAKSFRDNDAAGIGDWLTEDFSLIDHEGKTNDKAAMLKAMNDKIIVFRRFDVGPTRSKTFHDAAIVQGPVQLELSYGRDAAVEVKGRFAVTAFFVMQDGRWRLSAGQMTAVKPRDSK